jgi:hypothetical protein
MVPITITNHPTSPTALYHAQVPGGPSGIAFALGKVTVFAPAEDGHLYVVRPADLLVSGAVEAGMAAWIIATAIEPRLARVSQERAA